MLVLQMLWIPQHLEVSKEGNPEFPQYIQLDAASEEHVVLYSTTGCIYYKAISYLLIYALILILEFGRH